MKNTCQNCTAEVANNQRFCPSCGQKTDTHRLNFHFIWHEIIHAFIHADKSIVNLTRQMATQPGLVVKNYVEGKRKRYFNPFSYFLIGVAIMALLNSFFHLMVVNGENKVTNMTTQHFNKILFLSVPISSFFSWLFFKKSGYNYWENFIYHIFVGGFRVVLFLFFAAGVLIFREHYYIVLVIYMFVGLLYNIYASKQFYGENWTWTVLKNIAVQFLTQFVLTAIILFVTVKFLK
jgi:RNA polymerase subunit RPABC4/transcription elongation factor Spt4